jgi:hypothetical protein
MFYQKSSEGDTGELHVPPALQAPVQAFEDVGRGGDDDEGDNPRDLNSSADTAPNTDGSASLSFGSDTEYLSDIYVIIDDKVKSNFSLANGSLLQPQIIQTLKLALEKQVVNSPVFFPVFSRYFLARGRSFKIMIADLLKQGEASQNKRSPLILRADVPRAPEAHRAQKDGIFKGNVPYFQR